MRPWQYARYRFPEWYYPGNMTALVALAIRPIVWHIALESVNH